jgi:hypothetical protein
MDRTENTVSNTFSTVASLICRKDRVENIIPVLLFTAIT